MAISVAPPADLLERFRQDLPYYAPACLVIQTKQATLVPLHFNFAQRYVQQRLAEQWRTEGRIRALILKARQEGITTLVAARNTRGCTLWPNQRAMVVADVDKRGAEIFAIYERFYEHLPPEVKPAKRWSSKGQLLWFDRPDGTGLDSRVSVETAKDVQAGRALTIHRLHCSEFAFWTKPEDTFFSLVQAVPQSASEIIIESTANGVGNLFHRMWEAAEAGENGYLPIFLPWFIHEEYQAPLTEGETSELLETLDDWERDAHVNGIEWEGERWKLSLEQLQWRRRTIRDNFGGDVRFFRQEFPSTAREAFLVSGNCFFDEEKLLAYEQSSRPPVARGNLMEQGRGIVFAPAERGALRVWEFPRAEQPCLGCKGKGLLRDGPPKTRVRCPRCKTSGRIPTRYVIGVDTAEGRQVAARATDASDPEGERGGRDKNSVDVFETESRRFVAQLHGNFAPEVLAREIWRLGHFYGSQGPMDRRSTREPSLVGVENNHSSGQTVLSKLRHELKYPRLFWSRRLNVRTEKTTDVLGWVTDSKTRPLMLDELSQAIREESIGYPNAAGLREMWTFVRAEDGRPEAQEGAHDDRVISAAITLQLAKHLGPLHEKPPEEPERADTPTGW